VRTRSNFKIKSLTIAGAVAAVLVGAQLAGLPQTASATPNTVANLTSTTQQGPSSFAALAEQVKPAVVSIAVTGTKGGKSGSGKLSQQYNMPNFPDGSPFSEFFKHFYKGQPGTPGGNGGHQIKGAGTGFIISDDGYIVTNHHVIEHADTIEVIMQDGGRHQATVRGHDVKTDLALLKVDVDDSLPYVTLGNSDEARVGEWVVAVGNPFGLGGTVTAGIISARGRDIQSGPFDDFIQIDAPINRGNSGGPLFDNKGNVIGINTAIFSPSGGNVGIGFAIPSNIANDVIAQLKSEGQVQRGWLGVQIQPLTKDIAESLELDSTDGALVAAVENDSPAQYGGIKPGDVIVSLDGLQLEDFKDLAKRIALIKPGSDTSVEISRQGKTHQLDIEIARAPGGEQTLALADKAQNDDTPKLGVYLSALTPETRQQYRIDQNSTGVLVAGVEAGSPASKAGMQEGQIINMVGQQTVNSPQDVIDQVQQAAKAEKPSVLLMVEHNGTQRFIAVKFAEV